MHELARFVWCIAGALSLCGAIVTTLLFVASGGTVATAIPCGFLWLFTALCNISLILLDIYDVLHAANAPKPDPAREAAEREARARESEANRQAGEVEHARVLADMAEAAARRKVRREKLKRSAGQAILALAGAPAAYDRLLFRMAGGEANILYRFLQLLSLVAAGLLIAVLAGALFVAIAKAA